jgi:cytochrome b pre-mRNA-processing protein 3
MLNPLFRRTPHDTICALYGTIVAQARRPAFYLDYGVADTVTGRFELVVLHSALLLRRIAGEPALQTVSRGLFDEFCRDMDHNLREMGVGDTAVPKQMKRMGEAFFGRRNAYEAALVAAPQEVALVEVLRRNVYDGNEIAPVARMARYLVATTLDLASQDTGAIARGKLSFPGPESIGEWA